MFTHLVLLAHPTEHRIDETPFVTRGVRLHGDRKCCFTNSQGKVVYNRL